MIVRVVEGQAFRVDYQVTCDASWCLRLRVPVSRPNADAGGSHVLPPASRSVWTVTWSRARDLKNAALNRAQLAGSASDHAHAGGAACARMRRATHVRLARLNSEPDSFCPYVAYGGETWRTDS